MPIIEYHNLPAGVAKHDIDSIVFDFTQKLKLNIGKEIIEILFFSKEEIRELNKRTRGVDESTDVLSFPQAVCPSDSRVYGSIIISPQDANDREEGIDELVKHGLLHLAGYDHDSDPKTWTAKAKLINHNMGV